MKRSGRSGGVCAAVCAVLAATFAAAGVVAAPVDDEAAPAEIEAAEPERPLIERALVLVPERVGDFELVAFQDYEGRPEMGVGARYSHRGFPDVAMDFFIYPFGDFNRDKALDALEERMRAELRDVEASGRYHDLQFGETADIDLQRIDEDGSLQPVRDGLIGRGDSLSVDIEGAKKDLERTLVAETARVERHVRDATDPDLGRRLPIRLRLEADGEPRQSVSFLFLRALHAVKVRATSPLANSPDVFDRFANRAVADIVPRVVIRNAGGCAKNVIEIDPDADPDVGALMLAVKSQMSLIRAERKQCDDTLDERVPEGMRGKVIEVGGIWE